MFPWRGGSVGDTLQCLLSVDVCDNEGEHPFVEADVGGRVVGKVDFHMVPSLFQLDGAWWSGGEVLVTHDALAGDDGFVLCPLWRCEFLAI